jgi:pyroglutamyl-peptidase
VRILLTGFGPFPGAPFNPSAALVKALARRRRPAFAEIDRVAHVFATTYASVDRELPKLLAPRPDIVLMFGLAGRRRHVCIETRARNAVTMLFPDATGCRPQRGVIALGGPTALMCGAPAASLLGAARTSDVPARLSRDAGRYLCNYAYWQALQKSSDGRPLIQFVHIPNVALAQQPRRRAKRRSPSLAQLTTAAEAVLIALIAASRRSRRHRLPLLT